MVEVEMVQFKPKRMRLAIANIAIAVLLVDGLCLCAFAGEALRASLADKLVAGGKTLTSVVALNSARQYQAEVSAGETCRIFSGSTLHRLSGDSEGMALVQYRPSLVFLSTGAADRGELMNVWSDFRIPGRPAGFCPAGTRFALNSETLEQWERTRQQLVLYPRPGAEGHSAGTWVLREQLADIGGK